MMTELERGIVVSQMQLALAHYAKLYAEWEKFHRQSLRLGGRKDADTADVHDVVLERMSRKAVVKTWEPLIQPPACEVMNA